MNMQEWITGYAAALGTAVPDDDEIEQLLDLAAAAAHASERMSAPLSCWLAARAQVAPAAALVLARELAGEA
jgi:Domain of unknown function (DUF6457)